MHSQSRTPRYLLSLLLVFLIAQLLRGALIAQLSGSYTIGAGGDYQNFSEAVTALNAQGITGTVVFNVFAGVYEPPVSTDPVIKMDKNIQGASAANRIIFRPDAASGASRENVILTKRNPVGMYQSYIAEIRSNYVTLEDFTLKNEDTITSGNTTAWMILIAPQSGQNEVRGVHVERTSIHCFSGRSRPSWAIALDGNNYDAHIKGNEFIGSIHGVHVVGLGRCYSTVVEGNSFKEVAIAVAPGGDLRGTCVQLSGPNLSIKYNTFDYAKGSGAGAISLGNYSNNFRIEGNVIKNTRAGGGGTYDGFTGISLYGESISGGIIANNMISGIFNAGTGMSIYASNVKIYHNTVILPERGIGAYGGATPLYIYGTGNKVINNILMEMSTLGNSFVAGAMFIYDTTGNGFDHNLLYRPSGRDLVRANSNHYLTLENWQSTGHDLNSVLKIPDFVDLYSDPHLFDCSLADDELRGIPVPEVTMDIDKELRSTERPFMGADEGLGELPSIFGLPVEFPVGGKGSWHFTAHDLDLDGAIDIIVTNNDIHNDELDYIAILWNDGDGNFSEPQHLFSWNNPDDVRVGFVNADHMPDLVISHYDTISILFGLGDRAFTAPVVISSISVGVIQDIQLEDYDLDGDTDILWLWTHHTDSGYVIIRINDGNGTFSWHNEAAVGAEPRQFKVADIDNDGFPDLVVFDRDAWSLNTLRNLGNFAPGLSRGFDAPVAHHALVYSEPTTSRFVAEDFDGDGDIDLILGRVGRADSLVVLRNSGSGAFEREAFTIPTRRYPRVIAAFDYDGDGDFDLVTANDSLDLHLLLNDGTGRFERTMLCGRTNLSSLPLVILAARIDNDDSPDVVVLGLNDTLTVFRNLRWIPVGIEQDRPLTIPARFELHQNYPNPFNPSTTIQYALPHESEVRLVIHNILGQEVITLVSQQMREGHHTVHWEGKNSSGVNVGSGVYFYRLEARPTSGGISHFSTRKMFLIR